MSTTSLPTPTPTFPARAADTAYDSRAWAVAGVAAGISAAGGILASGAAGAVYDPDIAGDAVAITDRVAELTPQILVFHTATMVACLLLLVFAAGLRRRLEARLPTSSLLPGVASSGLLLVSVAGLIGSGLTTEFVFGAADPELVVPESVAFFSHWMGTVPWLWAGAGVAALAVAAASLRHGAVAPWIGWFSLVLGALTTLLAVSPLQYMAGMVGPIWLVVTSIGLLVSGRARS